MVFKVDLINRIPAVRVGILYFTTNYVSYTQFLSIQSPYLYGYSLHFGLNSVMFANMKLVNPIGLRLYLQK